jgi:hypothetical protein
MQISSSTTTSPYINDADTAVRRKPVDEADTAQASEETTSTDEPSSVKSFAYGALGLEKPGTSETNSNDFYTAGKWVAAAATIGGIISLFV